ncbi:MAG: putative ribonuclease YlaK [Desulforhopalus sp.]|jgi:predicted ribonuclease YlaK
MPMPPIPLTGWRFMTLKSKVFILDTNVILHDSSCLYNFQEHDIIITITVLEELDSFQKGQQIDHPYLDSNSNGLSSLIFKMQGQKLCAHVDLQKGEHSELAELASDLL